MYRKFYEESEIWENSNTKEPLLIMGARQVGKTWLIKTFWEEKYKEFVYINLEERKDIASIFEGNLTPELILKQMSMLLGRKIDYKTAIVFDEIQQSERAITSLKYFCEAK